MGLAYYIVTNAEPGTFDACVNGKAVGRSASVINKYTEDLGIPTLDDLVSQSQEEIQGLMEEVGMEQPPAWYRGEKWFTAETALEWVNALKSGISKDGDKFSESEALLSDMNEYEEVLEKAKESGLKWHLAIDY